MGESRFGEAYKQDAVGVCVARLVALFLNPCCRMRCSCGHGEGEREGKDVIRE